MRAVSHHEVAAINKKYAEEQARIAREYAGQPIPAKPRTPYTWTASTKNVPSLADARKMLGLSSGPGTVFPGSAVPSGTAGGTYGAEAMDLAANGVFHTSSDWRTKAPACVSQDRVRNQGLCGSCYGVSSATTMSDRWCIQQQHADPNAAAMQWASEPIIGCTKGCGGNTLSSTWQRWDGYGSVPLSVSPYLSCQTKEQGGPTAGPQTPWCSAVFLQPLGLAGPPPSQPPQPLQPSHPRHPLRPPHPLQPAPIHPFALSGMGGMGGMVGMSGMGAYGAGAPRQPMKLCKPPASYVPPSTPPPFKQLKAKPSHWTANQAGGSDPYAVVGDNSSSLADNARKMIQILNADPKDGGGPIQVGFTVMRDFMGYQGGVYQPLTTDPKDEIGGHAVMVVGHGYDQSAGPYWLVQNSWGTDWGINGFFKIRMYLDVKDIPSTIPHFMVFEQTAHVGDPVATPA